MLKRGSCATHILVEGDEEQGGLVTMKIILMMMVMVTDRPHDCWRGG